VDIPTAARTHEMRTDLYIVFANKKKGGASTELKHHESMIASYNRGLITGVKKLIYKRVGMKEKKKVDQSTGLEVKSWSIPKCLFARFLWQGDWRVGYVLGQHRIAVNGSLSPKCVLGHVGPFFLSNSHQDVLER
jgi:hypothetical protein